MAHDRIRVLFLLFVVLSYSYQKIATTRLVYRGKAVFTNGTLSLQRLPLKTPSLFKY
jgi:hypothetical protein